jgi:hypothetical protein
MGLEESRTECEPTTSEAYLVRLELAQLEPKSLMAIGFPQLRDEQFAGYFMPKVTSESNFFAAPIFEERAG